MADVHPGDIVVKRTRLGYRLARIRDVDRIAAQTEDGAIVEKSRPVLVAVRSPLPEVRT